MKILIDNGHGSNTSGKCSPDRRYHEWSYTRQIAAAIVRQLKYAGYDADLLVPKTTTSPSAPASSVPTPGAVSWARRMSA